MVMKSVAQEQPAAVGRMRKALEMERKGDNPEYSPEHLMKEYNSKKERLKNGVSVPSRNSVSERKKSVQERDDPNNKYIRQANVAMDKLHQVANDSS